MDQKLTAMNKALARNCDAPIDDVNGATAKNWRNGKPVRVVRNNSSYNWRHGTFFKISSIPLCLMNLFFSSHFDLLFFLFGHPLLSMSWQIRNHKGSKTSKYAPKEGNRYDGIYKIVKYWPEKGKSGFIIWKYLIRRDDEVGVVISVPVYVYVLVSCAPSHSSSLSPNILRWCFCCFRCKMLLNMMSVFYL